MSDSSRPDLPPDTLVLERTIMIGDIVSDMFYGSMVILFLQTIYALCGSRKSKTTGRRNYILTIFTVLHFALGSLFVFTDLHELRLAFIDNREFPGGPTAYTFANYASPVTTTTNTCFVLSAWLADGFLLYRCIMVFRFRAYILLLPILMYLGTIALGILLLYQTAQPSATLWTKVSISFGLPYFSLSMSLNIVMTILIACRLLLFRRKLLRSLGPAQITFLPYVSVAAMVVESSLFYAIFSLLFIGTYASNNHLSFAFLPILSQVQILAPLLITFRVATRRAWERATVTAPLSSMRFDVGGARPSDTTPDGTNSSATVLSQSDSPIIEKEAGVSLKAHDMHIVQ